MMQCDAMRCDTVRRSKGLDVSVWVWVLHRFNVPPTDAFRFDGGWQWCRRCPSPPPPPPPPSFLLYNQQHSPASSRRASVCVLLLYSRPSFSPSVRPSYRRNESCLGIEQNRIGLLRSVDWYSGCRVCHFNLLLLIRAELSWSQSKGKKERGGKENDYTTDSRRGSTLPVGWRRWQRRCRRESKYSSRRKTEDGGMKTINELTKGGGAMGFLFWLFFSTWCDAEKQEKHQQPFLSLSLSLSLALFPSSSSSSVSSLRCH